MICIYCSKILYTDVHATLKGPSTLYTTNIGQLFRFLWPSMGTILLLEGNNRKFNPFVSSSNFICYVYSVLKKHDNVKPHVYTWGWICWPLLDAPIIKLLSFINLWLYFYAPRLVVLVCFVVPGVLFAFVSYQLYIIRHDFLLVYMH